MKQFQVTIGASATRLTTTQTFAREAFLQPDDSAGAIMAIGGTGVAIGTGFLVKAKDATYPHCMHLGPYNSAGVDLSTLYVAGTASQKLNVIFEPF